MVFLNRLIYVATKKQYCLEGPVLDKERFVSQIDAYSVMMYRLAWTILRNDADCADALQESQNSALKFFWESIRFRKR